MNLKDLKNKSILLFGKSRAFSEAEFEAQMKFHKITLVKEYVNGVEFIVDGKMMTPYEQIESEKLYEDGIGEFISIDLLEKKLAKEIDEDTLLMSLKLSHDKERLKDFLKNSSITDKLFFRLITMYSWGGEGFFDNNDNRDVTASLISRFYKNIERNHNVQYATTGLVHLISQTDNDQLLEVIANLEPLKRSLKSRDRDFNFNILKALATHPHLPKTVLKILVKSQNSELKSLIAMDCDLEFQKIFYDEGLFEALSYNKKLDMELAKKLVSDEIYAKNIAKNINLNNEIFEFLFCDYALELATNPSLNDSMFEKLYEKNSERVNDKLFENSSIPKEMIEDTFRDRVYLNSLAKNIKTPKNILEELSKSSEPQILENLAKNENTPIEILYQLQLDSRFERYVKSNAGFGKYIQTNNIGWEV